ncbi:hypothetical protein F4803DRAFT_472634 [Xylaria telfairii]|nr:hypothetical protein F4803DRAFT_472634 [Xylaria telfairii]
MSGVCSLTSRPATLDGYYSSVISVIEVRHIQAQSPYHYPSYQQDFRYSSSFGFHLPPRALQLPESWKNASRKMGGKSYHFQAPALRMTSSNSALVTPRPMPAPPLASRTMSRSSASSTSCLSVMATRLRCARVSTSASALLLLLLLPAPANNRNASSTSAASGPSPARACSLSAQMARNGSYVACPSSSGSMMERNSFSSGFEGGRPSALHDTNL